MKTIFFPDETCSDGSYMATIGFFDGVHRGHLFLINGLRQEARQRGLLSMVITFEHHPRQVVHPSWRPELLTTLDEKRELMAQTGIDVLVVLRFDEKMAQLSARDFMEKLHNELHVACLLTGYDNRFGHNRTEGFTDFVRYGQELAMDVTCGETLTVGKSAVSSSRIRQLLKDGKVGQAAECLGRKYEMSGLVVHGEQIGRTIGFPTANLQCDDEKLVPRNGVYAALANIGHGPALPAVMNIGTRPTFDGECRTVEVNIIDGTGDFYGQRIMVSLVARLRDEQHFPSADALRAQIIEDKEQAKQILK